MKTCSKHKTYKGSRPPIAKCDHCRAIWLAKEIEKIDKSLEKLGEK